MPFESSKDQNQQPAGASLQERLFPAPLQYHAPNLILHAGLGSLKFSTQTSGGGYVP